MSQLKKRGFKKDVFITIKELLILVKLVLKIWKPLLFYLQKFLDIFGWEVSERNNVSGVLADSAAAGGVFCCLLYLSESSASTRYV